MFGNKPGPKAIDSLIGAKTSVNGDVDFDGGLRVDGKVVGHVKADAGRASTLVVSELACVRGSVSAGHVVINGTVEGPIHAYELLELQPKARVRGDITYKAVEIHVGAVIEGQLRHSAEGDLAKPDLKVVPGGTISAESA